jgi:hypothetical protein
MLCFRIALQSKAPSGHEKGFVDQNFLSAHCTSFHRTPFRREMPGEMCALNFPLNILVKKPFQCLPKNGVAIKVSMLATWYGQHFSVVSVSDGFEQFQPRFIGHHLVLGAVGN